MSEKNNVFLGIYTLLSTIYNIMLLSYLLKQILLTWYEKVS